MSTPPPRRSTGKIVLIVLGAIVALIGLALLAGGGTLLWAHAERRDSQGYFTTATHRFATQTRALASEDLDVASKGPHWLFESGRLARIRIRARSDKPIFIGIARPADVKRYLGNTSYTEVKNIDFDPFRVDYVPRPGTGKPASPDGRRIWVASANGSGTLTLTWALEGGHWSVVVMNADASPGVAADVSLGAKISWLIWAAIGLLVGGVIVLGGGALMIFFGARRPAPAAPSDPRP
jgi:hypothetical protein